MGRPRAGARATKWELLYLAALDGAEDSYLYALRRESPRHGWQMLQLACLEDACRVLKRGGYKKDRRIFERDVLWVTGQTPSLPGFSFAEICESMGYDAGAWRARLVGIAQEVRDGVAARTTRQLVTRRRAPKRRKAA